MNRAGAVLEKPKHCNQWLMRCVKHTGNSNHYLACRGPKLQEAIDYLFDMLLELKAGTRTKIKQGLAKSCRWTQTVAKTARMSADIVISVCVCFRKIRQ